jgi:hypothetical protein
VRGLGMVTPVVSVSAETSIADGGAMVSSFLVRCCTTDEYLSFGVLVNAVFQVKVNVESVV